MHVIDTQSALIVVAKVGLAGALHWSRPRNPLKVIHSLDALAQRGTPDEHGGTEIQDI